MHILLKSIQQVFNAKKHVCGLLGAFNIDDVRCKHFQWGVLVQLREVSNGHIAATKKFLVRLNKWLGYCDVSSVVSMARAIARLCKLTTGAFGVSFLKVASRGLCFAQRFQEQRCCVFLWCLLLCTWLSTRSTTGGLEIVFRAPARVSCINAKDIRVRRTTGEVLQHDHENCRTWRPL